MKKVVFVAFLLLTLSFGIGLKLAYAQTAQAGTEIDPATAAALSEKLEVMKAKLTELEREYAASQAGQVAPVAPAAPVAPLTQAAPTGPALTQN